MSDIVSAIEGWLRFRVLDSENLEILKFGDDEWSSASKTERLSVSTLIMSFWAHTSPNWRQFLNDTNIFP